MIGKWKAKNGLIGSLSGGYEFRCLHHFILTFCYHARNERKVFSLHSQCKTKGNFLPRPFREENSLNLTLSCSAYRNDNKSSNLPNLKLNAFHTERKEEGTKATFPSFNHPHLCTLSQG